MTDSTSPYLNSPPLTTREREVLKLARKGLAACEERDAEVAAIAGALALKLIISILDKGE